MIREAFWRFDPIRVRENRADIPDEYDCMVGFVLSRLAQHSGGERLEGEVAAHVLDHIGIPREGWDYKGFIRAITANRGN